MSSSILAKGGGNLRNIDALHDLPCARLATRYDLARQVRDIEGLDDYAVVACPGEVFDRSPTRRALHQRAPVGFAE